MGAMKFFVGCYEKDDPSVRQTLAWYDVATDTWVRNEEEMNKSLMQSERLKDEEKSRREIIRTTGIFDIRLKNGHGWAMTGEDLIGDERFRTRGMSFCLFRNTKALCGDGTVANLADGPKGDLTPYALQILRSIQFLANAPSSPAK